MTRAAITTPSERVVAVLEAAGGSLPRAEVGRRLAVRVGLKATREALALAVIGGYVTLDEYDVMRVSAA